LKGIEIKFALNSKSKHIFAKKSPTVIDFKVYSKEGMTNIDYIYQKQRSYALLGLKSWDVLVLKKMFTKGMNVTCFNFSHGMYAYHQKTFKNFKLAMCNIQIVCGVLLDTKVFNFFPTLISTFI